MTKRFAISFAIYTGLIVVSAIAGLKTTYLVDMLPIEMPDSVEAFIRFWLSCTGTEYLGNPDDMEVLALLLCWSIATLLIVLALVGLKRWLSRYLTARKRGEAVPKMPLSVTVIASLFALLIISDLAWYLTSPLTLYPFHIPLPVKAIIRFCLSVTGQSVRSDQDLDMLSYAMDFYWAVATLAIGVPVFLCCLVLRRLLHRKTS
ncbi:hypothetical protein B0G75_106196 [Paraburkholderia sp. BL18I3N2]|uniref:hypothetical protein n=1 Tax=Paraburkholderia sp. BL18I3N2 TaxID=1938799 RepID=UPI000D052A84|nr:hypothetical protein [Paraburkholderia sp. BL18I3N2]PRX30756.1 hypothetical protein B0G75_106196 [Paraburkholderia sp. BL18I3N2]